MVAYCRLILFHALKMLTNWLRIRRVGLRRDSVASCMNPSRSRLHSRLLNHRRLRRFRCLHFELEIAMHAGTAGSDAKWGLREFKTKSQRDQWPNLQA